MATDLPTHVDAAIIGAGFSGLYALHRLRDELGLSVRLFEAAGGLGGTWYLNRYPGAKCDSESHVYCFSFDEDLLQEWNWSGKYPGHGEIRRYLRHVAERFDLNRSIDLNTRVTAARYDEASATWTVTTSTGEVVTASYFVTGIGVLAVSPYTPQFPGMDSFQGEVYHTGGWPHEGVDLRGKRVGVVGTGSSGTQAVPVIAEQAEHLTVFMRTAQYGIPAREETATPAFFRDVKNNYPEIFETARQSAGGFPWEHNGIRALDVSATERQTRYEAGWAEGGFKFALGSFRDVAYDPDANATMSDFMREKIRETVRDPETREKLIPQHPFLSRRPIVESGYFEAYNRDNVQLKDVRSNPIVEFTPRGLRTSEAEHELDVVVFATGFDAVTGPFFRMDLTGRNGAKLTDNWADGPRAFMGLQTVDFPNMFMVTGPGSTVGNLPLTIETHVDWITNAIADLRRDGLASIEASPQAEAQWSEHVAGEVERSLIPQAESWYTGANIPGKKRAPYFYFGHFGKYRQMLVDSAAQGYPGFIRR